MLHLEAPCRAKRGGRRARLALRLEVAGKVEEGARKVARLARALEAAVRERQVLLHVTVGAIEIGQVKAVAAVHGVPAHRLLERLDASVVVAGAHARKREVRIEAVQGLTHVMQGAGIALHATVAQAVKNRGKAEPLVALGGRAVTVDVLLGILCETGEKLPRRVVLLLQDKSLGLLEAVCQRALALLLIHVPLPWPLGAKLTRETRGMHCSLVFPLSRGITRVCEREVYPSARYVRLGDHYAYAGAHPPHATGLLAREGHAVLVVLEPFPAKARAGRSPSAQVSSSITKSPKRSQPHTTPENASPTWSA